MNDLQILLISAGVILIVIVLAYNGWQEWRARRSMQADSGTDDRHDVLLQEPVARREPTIQHSHEDNQEIDALCEAVIDINFSKPVAAASLNEALLKRKNICTKPVRFFATNTNGEHHTRIDQHSEYNSMQLAVLLANRSGALSKIDWSHLWSFAQSLADSLDGILEAPDQAEVIARAKQLDELCASMDAQVGLILQLEQPLSAKHIGAFAIEKGFVNNSGNWLLLSDNGILRYSLVLDQAAGHDIHRVDLLLDVPNSVPDNHAFSNMVQLGRSLADDLQAHVLDDQGRTFQDSSAAAIDKQLSDLYDKLDNAGFVAGTQRAARVFA